MSAQAGPPGSKARHQPPINTARTSSSLYEMNLPPRHNLKPEPHDYYMFLLRTEQGRDQKTRRNGIIGRTRTGQFDPITYDFFWKADYLDRLSARDEDSTVIFQCLPVPHPGAWREKKIALGFNFHTRHLVGYLIDPPMNVPITHIHAQQEIWAECRSRKALAESWVRRRCIIDLSMDRFVDIIDYTMERFDEFGAEMLQIGILKFFNETERQFHPSMDLVIVIQLTQFLADFIEVLLKDRNIAARLLKKFDAYQEFLRDILLQSSREVWMSSNEAWKEWEATRKLKQSQENSATEVSTEASNPQFEVNLVFPDLLIVSDLKMEWRRWLLIPILATLSFCLLHEGNYFLLGIGAAVLIVLQYIVFPFPLNILTVKNLHRLYLSSWTWGWDMWPLDVLFVGFTCLFFKLGRYDMIIDQTYLWATLRFIVFIGKLASWDIKSLQISKLRALISGCTWNWQAWYLDPLAGLISAWLIYEDEPRNVAFGVIFWYALRFHILEWEWKHWLHQYVEPYAFYFTFGDLPYAAMVAWAAYHRQYASLSISLLLFFVLRRAMWAIWNTDFRPQAFVIWVFTVWQTSRQLHEVVLVSSDYLLMIVFLRWIWWAGLEKGYKSVTLVVWAFTAWRVYQGKGEPTMIPADIVAIFVIEWIAHAHWTWKTRTTQKKTSPWNNIGESPPESPCSDIAE